MAFVVPSLSFNGNCEEAFTFYKSVFGGEFQQFMRWKDMPSEQKITDEEGEKVMHVALPIGKDTVIMGGDKPANMGELKTGNNFDITIIAESEEEATRLFNGLSAGGKITMPLDKAFWGAYFGMFTDKFGIQWMVNYDYSKK